MHSRVFVLVAVVASLVSARQSSAWSSSSDHSSVPPAPEPSSSSSAPVPPEPSPSPSPWRSSSGGGPVPCDAWDPHCVGTGKKCTADWHTGASCSTPGALCCRFPLHCVSGHCAEDNRNTNCTKHTDCVVNFYGSGMHACVNGTCELVGNAMDSCTTHTHCAGGMRCIKGKCEGLPPNSTCVLPVPRTHWGTTRYVCASDLVCAPASLTCVPGAQAGASCATLPCAMGLTCNKGVCVAVYSLDVGAGCTSDIACSPKSVCENGKCVEGDTKHDLVQCDSDADCKEGTNNKCEVCSHVAGQRFCGASPRNIDCRAQWKKAYACYVSKRCAPVPSSNLDMCSQDACPAETNAILSCDSNCWSFRDHYGSCASAHLLKNCPLIPTWTRVLIGFGVLVAIVAIILILFLVVRKLKTKGYTPLPSSH